MKQRFDQLKAYFSEERDKNYLKSTLVNIPHYKKMFKGGEDSWICTEQIVAVADGVGGWNNRGVDPGLFSRELCWHVLCKYQQETVFANKKQFEVDLTNLLVDGVKKTQSPGTSTFVMALLDKEDPYLRGLNFGDSGYMLMRRNGSGEFFKVFRSEERQYRFNAPWQCGTGKALPTNSDVFLHRVQDKDVLLLASDGVFDNATESDILNCVNINQVDLNPKPAAQCIADRSLQLSKDKSYDSPFAVNSRIAGKNHVGGKKDDITVVLSQIHLH